MSEGRWGGGVLGTAKHLGGQAMIEEDRTGRKRTDDDRTDQNRETTRARGTLGVDARRSSACRGGTSLVDTTKARREEHTHPASGGGRGEAGRGETMERRSWIDVCERDRLRRGRAIWNVLAGRYTFPRGRDEHVYERKNKIQVHRKGMERGRRGEGRRATQTQRDIFRHLKEMRMSVFESWDTPAFL